MKNILITYLTYVELLKIQFIGAVFRISNSVKYFIGFVQIFIKDNQFLFTLSLNFQNDFNEFWDEICEFL